MSFTPKEFSIKGTIFKPFIDEETIKKKVSELASRLEKDYAGKKPVFLIVLKGSIFFASDLLREISFDCEIETVKAVSYGDSMESAGEVKLILSAMNLKGKHLVIVEDIVDTGTTLKTLFDKLATYEPASMEAVAFLSKPAQRTSDVDVKYVGMEIPPKFVVGYGLDYAEQGRNLPLIYAQE